MRISKLLVGTLVLASLTLPSCATTHAVRWTYGMPSIWPEPDPDAERVAVRAAAGAPVIVGSFAFDAVTWPIQLIFGVWPMWGEDSTQMKPPEVRDTAAEPPAREEPETREV